MKRNKITEKNAMAGQEVLFDLYGYPPLRVEEMMTASDPSYSRFALGGMKFQFHPKPQDSALAMAMTIAGLVEVYLVYNHWHYTNPSIEIESWGLPCNAFVVSARKQRDDGKVYASFCAKSKILEISLPHRTMWHKAGLRWLATYKYCCVRHSKNPQPWMGKACNCE